MRRLLLATAALVALSAGLACEVEPDAVARPSAPAPADAVSAGLHPHLVIHRKAAGAIVRIGDGELAHPGDIVQVSYVAAGNRHGVVLSLDGGGTVTLHHPRAVGDPPALQARGEQPLPHAFELDAAPEFERFVFVTSGDTPTEVERVLEAARSVAGAGPAIARVHPLPLPPAWRQTSVVLDKEPP